MIKSFARERQELERFSAAGAETMQARLRLTWQESLLSVAVSAITLSGTALVLAVGGLHVLDGTLTVGSLLVVVAYLAAVTRRSRRSPTPPAPCSRPSSACAACAKSSR